jgi:hypothetical protein
MWSRQGFAGRPTSSAARCAAATAASTCHFEKRSDEAISRPAALYWIVSARLAIPGEVSDSSQRNGFQRIGKRDDERDLRVSP